MANLIQIKRSITNANPVGLANGELAFTSNGNVLFIGSPNGSTIAIGGLRTPGVLTANQALVANTTSGIDKIIVANLAPTQIWANNSLGTSGQVLHSNGTGIYWATDDQGVTSVAIGNGLTGGTITTTGTVSVLANNGISANATGLYVTAGAGVIVNAAGVNVLANNGITANSTGLFVTRGTGTVVNATGVHVNSSYIATLSANNATYLNGQLASYYTNATNLATGTVPTARLGSGTANSTTFLSGDQTYKAAVTSVASGNGLAGGPITTAGTLSVLAADGIVANATGTYVRAGTGVTVNSTGVHIGQAVATTSNVTFADLTVNGNTKLGDAATDVVTYVGKVNTHILPSANVTYSLGNANERWDYLYAGNVHTNFGYISGSLQVGGDLVVAGNLVTVNTSSLIVQDPLIYLASNNYSSDLVDIGFAGSYYDGVNQRHAGVIRHADNREFYIFDNYLPEPNTNVIDIANTSFRLASLNTYLKSGALQTNSAAVSVTANSTVSVSITANTLSLSTALAGTSGGTGHKTVTNNAILVGNSTNGFTQLSLGTAGYVLQSNGTALVYDILDGGSF